MKYIVAALILTISLPLSAGPITAQGGVVALTDVSQMANVVGIADFDSPPGAGITFLSGDLSSVLPSITATCIPGDLACGKAFNLTLCDGASWTGTGGSPVPKFPGPISGGGIQAGCYAQTTGVAVFDLPVTQFGLTAGKNGPQYITAFNTAGGLIGQVTWSSGCGSDPDCLVPSSFVGIDTLGILIGAIAYGNDDLFNGNAYNVAGTTNVSDTWIWASGSASIPEPSSLALLSLGLTGIAWRSRRHRKP